MHIGLIGGIGPAATVYYYKELVRLFEEAKQKMVLTIVHADSREMVANMMAGRFEAQAEIFARYTDQLKAGGCDAVALTSMGGHFCMRAFEPRASLPVLNAIPIMDRTFSALGFKRVGILGTRAVMDSGLYGVASAQIIAPAPEERDRVHEAYTSMASIGVATDGQRTLVENAATRLYREQRAEAIVLGGTDLFLAFDRGGYEYPIIDCALIHARAIADLAFAKT